MIGTRICFLGVLGLVLSGCSREPDPEYVLNKQTQELPEAFKAEVVEQLAAASGTYAKPMLLGDDAISADHLRHGQAVYTKRCVHCHGETGDGKGPAAPFLHPKPRDYRLGIFKFKSTPYQSRPRREDLERTVHRGIPGTSMPSFKFIPEKDLEAVVDYVLVLTHRGELEKELAYEGEFLAEEVDPDDPESLETTMEEFREAATGFGEEIVEMWKEARGQEVHPVTPMPEFTIENVRLGRKAFLTKGCSKCHGEDGRGMTRDNIGKDDWGDPIKAADLTSGLLRGGARPIDVYQRIYSGISGTPMPAFKNALQAEPETIWNLVAYVMYVSNRRRSGEIPLSGPISPMVSPSETDEPDNSQN